MSDLPPENVSPEKRLLRLPDDPQQQEAALKAAKCLDPDARIYPLPPAAGGPHLKSGNPKAIFAAKLTVIDTMPRKFGGKVKKSK
ncbi:hypothetical protein [Sphingomonas yabuuchiae]|uniref:hypothetical protein n=1 Tax=Sphingomonas yabuuchiae TaxID=172044 RepID=UPI003D983DDD